MVLAPDKALPAKKDETKFTPAAAASYASHQTSEKVTIGVLPYFNDEDTRPVFGKHNPYTYGVLPVLVVIQNDSGKTIKVQSAAGGMGGAERRPGGGDARQGRPLSDRATAAQAPVPGPHRKVTEAQESAGYLADRGPRFRRRRCCRRASRPAASSISRRDISEAPAST